MAASNDHVKAIAILLDRGATRRAVEWRSFTPLHAAVNANSQAATALLLDRGMDVDVRTRKDEPPAGTRPGKLSSFQTMAWAGWHIGGKSELGQTPLHRAAYRGYGALVELLLDRHADVNALDGRHQTPLHLAVAGGATTAAAILRARGADDSLRDDEGRIPAERSGDHAADDQNRRRGLRRLLWLIRIYRVVTFPVRVVKRAQRLIAPRSVGGRRPGS